MIHLPELIQDLGFILIAAAIVSLLFKAFHQPVVLGYLIAGFLVGPHVSITPTVIDAENLKIWGEIGVIFLLFGLGLEFSFKKLAQVGVTSSITALFEIGFMVGVGFLSGTILGWSPMDSLFLGGILSISSTTIIVRALNEVGLKSRRFVKLVFGVLIVEDLVAILLLVLLSTVAVTRSFAGRELMMSTLKLVFFVVVWFIMGIYSLPLILRKIRAYMDSESTLIVAIGLCLLMVIIATQTGFSAPLGAFVMGSLLAETRDGRTIEKLIDPVKNLFAAIFFVTVGMMFDPQVVMQNLGTVLFLTLVTIVGKFLSSSIGALIAGQSLRHSIQSGLSLAQIGEFSFIIATLGISLKVTNEILYPMAVAISSITTLTTPYLMRLADPLSDRIEKALSEDMKARLLRYQSAVFQSQSTGQSGHWSQEATKILVNSVLILAATFAVKKYLFPWASEWIGTAITVSLICVLVVIVISSPFLWALTLGYVSHHRDVGLRPVEMFLAVVRTFLGLFFIGFIIFNLTQGQQISPILHFGIFFSSLFLIRFAGPVYLSLEGIFISNLDDKKRGDHPNRPQLAPWDASLAEFTLTSDSILVAKTLQECALKEKYGVTVALIERGQKRIIAPSKSEFLFPYDRLFLIGSDEQLAQAQEVIEVKPTERTLDDLEVYGLESFAVAPHSIFRGKSIRDCGIREQVNGLIVGIERNGKRVLNPDSSTILYPEDLLWIVGERPKIRTIRENEMINSGIRPSE